MMKKTFLILLLSIIAIPFFSQSTDNKVLRYSELPNPISANIEEWNCVAWGDTDSRYRKEGIPNIDFTKKDFLISAWKGERVNSQFVLANKYGNSSFSYNITPLKSINKKDEISVKNIESGFVRYVMTDELNKDKKGGCGYRNKKDYDSTLVADPIDHLIKSIDIKQMQSQAVWVNIAVPKNANIGIYRANIDIYINDIKIDQLTISINVIDEVLPEPKDWKFHLDLWQNPYAVARIYNVPVWSKKHFEYLKTELKRYADAGGKVITASIINKPWNGQTYDHFDSMIKWTKKRNGEWEYDFSIFDNWVEFMMKLGVKKQINCYSMIPWNEKFQYFDEKSDSNKTISATPASLEYQKHWTPFIKAFAEHLRIKGWFEITHIAMDERPMTKMLAAIKVIKDAEPKFKISLAGALHNELINSLDDYCVALRMKFTPEQIAKRKAEQKVTTYYTSCEEPYPNTFTFSTPAESEWLGWYAAKENLDGYLRWALNSWVKNPLQDTRFISWAAGDTYLIYPGGRSSIRFQRMIDGIQAYEKIRILKERYRSENRTDELYLLEKILSNFDEKKISYKTAANFVNSAKNDLNNLVINKNLAHKDTIRPQKR